MNRISYHKVTNRGHINEFLVGHKITTENLKIYEWKKLQASYRENYEENINEGHVIMLIFKRLLRISR